MLRRHNTMGYSKRGKPAKSNTYFFHRGTRYSVGSFATEEAAARAHDEYVLRHGLDRELHFPSTGEERPRDGPIVY